MKVIGKDRTSCDVCNPIDEILARLDALERRASAIVAKVQGISPDGEGNVTLPTSSSDTDPLHGRVDAFAMSSEVKEAADDAHAYAASIADDVIVINSEIDVLNQAVAALQPEEIEAIKTAVQTLQTTVATLESTVDTLNNSVAGKVSKSGDTLTGDLIKKSTQYENNNFELTHHVLGNYQFNDKNNELSGYLRRLGTTSNQSTQIGCVASVGGKTVSATVEVNINSSGDSYATAPSWSPGTNDNSDKILTIKMANSLPSLVHTTGNESISGSKTFLGKPIIKGGRIRCVNPNLPNQSAPTSYQYEQGIIFEDSAYKEVGAVFHQVPANSTRGETHVTSRSNGPNRKEVRLSVFSPDDGEGYATAPTTPSGATGTEIATADWVLTKINELATKNNLTKL